MTGAFLTTDALREEATVNASRGTRASAGARTTIQWVSIESSRGGCHVFGAMAMMGIIAPLHPKGRS
jgi:hypothetical protein